MGIAFLRAVLSFGLLMLALSVIALILVPSDSDAVVPAVLSVGANGITVIGSFLILRWLVAREQD